MYYRIAIETTCRPTWSWVSTSLGSLNSVRDWLRFYYSLPRDRLCVFSASSRDDLSEPPLYKTPKLVLTPIPATRLMPAAGGGPGDQGEAVTAATRQGPTSTLAWSPLRQFAQSPEKSSTSPLDARRDELERGVGGDHDCPYRFSVPASTSELLAWARLLSRVLHDDLRAETSHSGAA
jgi:hypothetical protein